jgi:hypothetical protein
MTESEVEALVLETVRRYTANDAVVASSRFEADLRLSEAARQMLFASLAQAFAARGWSLPSHGFLQGDFLACTTPGEARDAIRRKVFGAPISTKPARAPAPPPAVARETTDEKSKPAAKRPAGARKPAGKKPAAAKRAKPSKKRR